MNNQPIIESKLLWLIPILLLLIALLPLPYVYYQILRWIVCGCALYIAYEHYQEKMEWNKLVITFTAIAILYIPIGAIHLFKEIWAVLNILTVVVFGYDCKTKRSSLNDKQGKEE
ncbi:MAG: hypothetical protein JKY11_07530 [Alphaproteobacteria bacterium]|nr:hypothetical protein [Alphaproteobacteria bacterium]